MVGWGGRIRSPRSTDTATHLEEDGFGLGGNRDERLRVREGSESLQGLEEEESLESGREEKEK